ncbi:hypothetical protein TR13x_09610 [Caloranaerobacter sp. TR13]|uniref:hypothetical protein n=1 Tax=Caloranaerobacter sp. TR13 TaxID=1302151 RepID=UPI0006D48A9A|nr:hypothetical protein [Caloranaerobacter sp. TR13]KPU26526.1 hypothetical protein TR13x_09610 [Caloranaerobacter sp. TR13]
MADYYINFDRELGLNSITKLLNTIGEINENDELIVTMDSNDAMQSRFIREALENNGFEVLPKGDHTGKKYKLIAHRKKGD